MILLPIKYPLVRAGVVHIHKPVYLELGLGGTLLCFCNWNARQFLCRCFTAPGLHGGADSSSPFQLTQALHERPAVSKVQMESCQQRDSFRPAYRMIHPWHEDRPGDGPTTLTPIGEPGEEHRCSLCRSAGRDQVRKKAANLTTWPLLQSIMSSLKTHAEMVKQNPLKPFTKSPVY